MDEKLRFVFEYERDEQTMTELCAQFGICRDTGYVWLRRYRQYGLKGLAELNRAARQHPNQTAAEVEQAVLDLRQAHMRWGPRKLKRVLERDQPGRLWPATSTIGEIVKRAGLVIARKKRRRTEPYTQPLAHANESNRVWCADFKGWFRSGDGTRIDPLTISDAYSRYLLRSQAVEKADTERVRAVFEAAFREHGLPEAIRTDNGVPFASSALGGLSRLAVWWIKLGIVPERIQAGHPEQNGRHERMHRTLKQELRPVEAGGRSNASWTDSAKSTTRRGRTKRWAWRRRPRSMSLRRDSIRRVSRRWSIRMRCACSGLKAKVVSAGKNTTCFSVRYCGASRLGCSKTGPHLHCPLRAHAAGTLDPVTCKLVPLNHGGPDEQEQKPS